MPELINLADQRKYKPEDYRKRTCEDKTKFKTEQAARNKAKRCARKFNIVFDIYNCPFCEGYHLTKRKK